MLKSFIFLIFNTWNHGENKRNKNGEFNEPSVFFVLKNELIYIVDKYNDRIQVFEIFK